MRVGYTVSIIGHAAILGFGLMAFPHARPFAVEEVESLPVDLVDIDEVTDLLEGSEDSEVAPDEEPQPVAEVEAPTPEPVEEEVAETPVEAARAPTPPPPPPPTPEPEPEPEEVAALPEPPEPPPPPEPEAEAVAEPEPQAPVESRVPRARPNPPKQVVEPPPAPVQEPPQEIVQQPPQEPEPEFNPDDIAALLNKQQPAGGGAPQPSPEPQTIGSIDGRPEAAMTQSEIAALSSRISRCWSPPLGARDAGGLAVEVVIKFLPDGSLAAEPEVRGGSFDTRSMAAADAARRAIIQCAPYGDILSPAKIAQLPDGILFNFDPSLMLGG